MRIKWPAIAIGLITAVMLAVSSISAAEPPRPDQPREDIFPIDIQYVPTDVDGNGVRNMQDLNPTNVIAKRDHAVRYKITTMEGCSTGTIPNDIQGMVTKEYKDEVEFSLIRDDNHPDFTIFISCGLIHIGKCGSIGVFCLADGFPYNTNIYLSDVLSGYTLESRLAIPLHELAHAVATWNEQYATCAASCNFAPTPNWPDFMNTGPLSRIGFNDITKERWERTMYPLAGERAVQPDGWAYDFGTGHWFDPKGRDTWYPCNSDGLRYNIVHHYFAPPGTPDYFPEDGFWSVTPAC